MFMAMRQMPSRAVVQVVAQKKEQNMQQQLKRMKEQCTAKLRKLQDAYDQGACRADDASSMQPQTA